MVETQQDVTTVDLWQVLTNFTENVTAFSHSAADS